MNYQDKSREELIEELERFRLEKEKRIADLVIANKELVYQNREKENRAAELAIADKELVYQNREKENRAAELAIADKELVYQNREKENRAAELAIADKELVYQNQEKENRASELAIADKELIYQNQEKENRADELLLSNSTNNQLTIIIEERKENERLLQEKNEEYLRLIEELNNAKLKIEESESKHKFLFDNSPLGKIYQNAEGEINDANRAAERILGLTLDQLQGLTSIDPRWKSIHDDGSDFPGDTHPAAITLQTGKPVNNVTMGVFNPLINNYTWININSIPRFKDGNSKPFEVIATFEDITERKQAEAEIKTLNETLEQRVKERTNQLEAVNKELESFSYSVSHDLRAPLRGIDGFSRILQKDFTETLNEQVLDYLARIRKASQTMGQLIDDMLKLSRITRAEMNIEKVNLSEIVSTITNEFKELNPNHKAEFVIESNIVVSGDKNLLRIAMQNLISNAWKYSSKNDSIKIEFGKTIQEDSTVYFIRDNGVGFNMKYVNKLFGAFQRLHSVSEFEGTGIGLATVNRIIVKHGGSIWAEAEINKGASFYFKL
jgi:signal transduction histidine kinase